MLELGAQHIAKKYIIDYIIDQQETECKNWTKEAK